MSNLKKNKVILAGMAFQPILAEILAGKSGAEVIIMDDAVSIPTDVPKELKVPIKPYILEEAEPLPEFFIDKHDIVGNGRRKQYCTDAKKKLKAKRRAQRHARSKHRKH